MAGTKRVRSANTEDASAACSEVTAARRPRGDRVTLQVGNEVFHTTASTLRNGGLGYSANLLGKTGEAFSDSEEEMFVDRDGTLFTHVLHWMRTRSLSAALYGESHLLIDVAAEAQFFGLEDLASACMERGAELKMLLEQSLARPASARSFSVCVSGSTDTTHPNECGRWKALGCARGPDLEGSEDSGVRCNQGDVIYLHSVVLAGRDARLGRIGEEQSDADGDHDSDYTWAENACYLRSGVRKFDGDFQLAYRRPHKVEEYVLSHRGLDDATGVETGLMHDINFREFLDVTIDGPIHLCARGLGVWTLHGWVGPLESIPRASGTGLMRMASTDATTNVAQRVAHQALDQASKAGCALM